MKKLWWQKPLRVIQTNLQVKDTPKMNPGKIADDIVEMGGNTLIINVGGIYAWYQSKVKYHHINEYLPKDYDLLKEIINECHKRGLKIVARFDFSKTDDYVFQEKPQWFVRDKNKIPKIYGKDRMGEWTLLLSTCINAGYRNEEFAIPVINEVLDNYDIDGIFFNAPHYELCYCDTCKMKYFNTYGKTLPDDPKDFEKDWPSRCLKDNMEKIYKAVKSKRPEIPVVLYYNPYYDNLNDRTETADILCTEPQDVLSLGWDKIPQFWKPAISIKVGTTLDNCAKPFGIIHSCPGMDWRHTGLPPAEYRFWLSQIPANGGNLWHSVTGFNDTISDKRIISTIKEINNMIKKAEAYMEDAEDMAQTLLIWDAKPAAEGWVEGLINTQTPFNVIADYQITLDKIKKYKIVIIPESFTVNDKIAGIIKEYVYQGGNVILEGTSRENLLAMIDIVGIEQDITTSEYLAASYLRLEGKDTKLQSGFENTPLLPHRGTVAYCHPSENVKVLATLVPPFAPLDGVGAPPERASIPTPYTDIPMISLNEYGKGKVLLLTFQLSMLIREYMLNEHYQLLKNCIEMLTGEDTIFSVDRVKGIQVNIYKKNNYLLIHFVNGIGQRPLVNNILYYDLNFSVKLPKNARVKSIRSCIADEEIKYSVQDNMLMCTLRKLDVWDMIAVEMEV